MIAFLLSGASALTYEILWQREMYLIFGASAPATTAILAAVFLGIACGSPLGGALLCRVASPYRLYGGLELLIGAWGLLVPALLNLSESVYLASVATVGEGHPAQSWLRFVLAIVPLLPATLAMGATVPVMVRCLAGHTGSAVARAYGMNILGAVAGCLLTGLVWIREYGISETRYIAAGINAAAVLVLWPLYRLGPRTAPTRAVPPLVDASGPRSVLLAYFVAGFVALGLEVVWLRFLGIVNTNSTLTFTLTLAVYLLGMSLGSLLVYPWLRRRMAPQSVFALASAGTAFAAILTFHSLYSAAAINQKYIVAAAKDATLTLSRVYWVEMRLTGTLMFLPTVFMGLVYPAVCDCAAGPPTARDRWHSRAYFCGTTGSVAGILLIAMGLIPTLGLHASFAVLVTLSLLVGGWMILLAFPQSARRPLWAPAAIVLGVGWAWTQFAMARPILRETRAVYRHGGWIEVAVDDSTEMLAEIPWIRAGSTATVMVKKIPGTVEQLVYVDDQLVASTNLEARVDSLMLAHLPLLLHPDPRSALTVGFGTGGTSHAMTTHGVDAVCVEIEREVPRAAHLLTRQNFSVLDNPRFKLLVNDARDHLHAGTRTYDVIATDVTNLQYKQNANLYTVEYFELMRRKLNPGGVACAWIPLAAIDRRELQVLMRGFQDVFPHATLWFMNHTHTNFGILIGTPAPLSVDYPRLAAAFADHQIAANLRLVQVHHPLQLVHCLHLDADGYRAFCGDGPRHTDNHPILEFSSPISFYNYYETFHDNLAATLPHRPTSFHQFVANLPAELGSEMERHAVASRSFCEVILLLYRALIDRERGASHHVPGHLAQAQAAAAAGMAAWPDDRARAQFYHEFFSSTADWAREP